MREGGRTPISGEESCREMLRLFLGARTSGVGVPPRGPKNLSNRWSLGCQSTTLQPMASTLHGLVQPLQIVFREEEFYSGLGAEHARAHGISVLVRTEA